MLDAFIIEEIKRREQERDSHRPRVDLPLPDPRPRRQNDTTEEDDVPPRGVVIIDYSIPLAS